MLSVLYDDICGIGNYQWSPWNICIRKKDHGQRKIYSWDYFIKMFSGFGDKIDDFNIVLSNVNHFMYFVSFWTSGFH